LHVLERERTSWVSRNGATPSRTPGSESLLIGNPVPAELPTSAPASEQAMAGDAVVPAEIAFGDVFDDGVTEALPEGLPFSLADIAAAERVLRAVADPAVVSTEAFGHAAFKDLRKSLASAFGRMSKKFFDGEDPRAFETKKHIRRALHAERVRQKELDRRFVDSTTLRKSRLEKMQALEDEHGGAVPMLTDGVAGESHLLSLEDATPATGELEAATATAREADNTSFMSERTVLGQQSGRIAVLEARLHGGDEGTLIPTAGGEIVTGDSVTLHYPRACYRCHARFFKLHEFYASMCPPCAEVNWTKRRQMTDLTGRIAVVTGSRVKIGFHVGTRLLRCGANLISVTRFPSDCARRYLAEKDSASFASRVHVYGIDLRATGLVELWCDWMYRRYSHLDILIQNSCQTIRRPPAYYLHLLEAELKAHHKLGVDLPPSARRMLRPYFDFLKWASIVTSDSVATADAAWAKVRERRRLRREAHEGVSGVSHDHSHDHDLRWEDDDEGVDMSAEEADDWGTAASAAWRQGDGGKNLVLEDVAVMAGATAEDASTAAASSSSHETSIMTAVAGVHKASLTGTLMPAPLMTQVATVAGDEHTDLSLFPQGATDTNEQQVDLRSVNSWLLRIHEVSAAEAAEVFSINALAPFVITGKLRDLMMRCPPAINPTFGTGCEPTKGVVGRRSSKWTCDVSKLDSSAITADKARNACGLGASPVDYSQWKERPDRFIVFVSAMEGKFQRRKQPTHAHTNAAKAALNMQVKTCGQDFARDRIFMTAVDTGWVNPEQPVELAKRIAETNHFQTPIDEVDAAARILDPILTPVELRRTGRLVGEENMPFWGVFLKDYAVSEW
jgi:NAD(P)-dependent dehydrogenase (short-subunit alcohol dehydrogenase family)